MQKVQATRINFLSAQFHRSLENKNKLSRVGEYYTLFSFVENFSYITFYFIIFYLSIEFSSKKKNYSRLDTRRSIT